MLHKNHILECMGKTFCVEFQRVSLKFHTKYLAHTLQDLDFIHRLPTACDILTPADSWTRASDSYLLRLESCRNSYFPWTIIEWNQLGNDKVTSQTIDCLWARLIASHWGHLVPVDNSPPIRAHILLCTGMILGLHPANERRHYKVTPSLTGRAQT